MTTTEILRAARAKVEKGWCQGPPAKDGNGHATYSGSDRACKWCSVGAIWSVLDATTGEQACAEVAIQNALGVTSLAFWNEKPGRTQAEVLEAFDKAIALAIEAETTP